MPRSPVPTDRGVDAIPERTLFPICSSSGAHGLSLRTRALATKKCGILFCTQVYGCFCFSGDLGGTIDSGQDGISTLGLYGQASVWGRIWEDIFCAILAFWRGHRFGIKWDQGYQFE